MSLMREVMGNLFRKPFTRRYPKKKVEPFERFRGRLVFHPKKCIGCQLCNRNCPSNAIRFHKKGKLEFDMKTCMQCGLCVDICHVGAITWSRKFDNAGRDRKKLMVR